MQKWEYWSILRTRSWEEVKGRPFWRGTDWTVPIEEVLKAGDEGWGQRSSVHAGMLGKQMLHHRATSLAARRHKWTRRRQGRGRERAYTCWQMRI